MEVPSTMFMCKHCLEQYEDQDLAYTLILESRLSHPMADSFLMKFCSRAHLQEFLQLSSGQKMKYVLTQVGSNGEKTFPADYPLELLLQLGSRAAQ